MGHRGHEATLYRDTNVRWGREYLNLPPRCRCSLVVRRRGATAEIPSGDASLRRYTSKSPEYTEVGWVGSQERLDAGLPVGRGQQRVQQSLPAQRELLQPGEKLTRRAVV